MVKNGYYTSLTFPPSHSVLASSSQLTFARAPAAYGADMQPLLGICTLWDLEDHVRVLFSLLTQDSSMSETILNNLDVIGLVTLQC